MTQTAFVCHKYAQRRIDDDVISKVLYKKISCLFFSVSRRFYSFIKYFLECRKVSWGRNSLAV